MSRHDSLPQKQMTICDESREWRSQHTARYETAGVFTWTTVQDTAMLCPQCLEFPSSQRCICELRACFCVPELYFVSRLVLRTVQLVLPFWTTAGRKKLYLPITFLFSTNGSSDVLYRFACRPAYLCHSFRFAPLTCYRTFRKILGLLVYS